MGVENKKIDNSKVKSAIELLILSLGLDPQKLSKAKKLLIFLKNT